MIPIIARIGEKEDGFNIWIKKLSPCSPLKLKSHDVTVVPIFAPIMMPTACDSFIIPDYKKKTAFLIGNEGNGLSDEIADLADTYIKIPMQGQVESLNAAISASLLMYETGRQRRH